MLPDPARQAVLDYVVLDERGREPTGASGSASCSSSRTARSSTATCRRAGGPGSQVVGIDLEAFALLRSLEAPTDRDANDGALVAVAIGHDRTTIAVSTGRHCEFARVLDWGGWSLNVAIARELDRAPSEVESIKRQLSFAHETEVEGLTAEQVAKTRNGIQRALATFARELVSSLQFYQAQPGALGIGEIVLTGGTAHMDGLVDAVGELVGVPMRLGDPFGRVKVGPKRRARRAARLGRGRDRPRNRGLMRAVNLLPRDLERQRGEGGRAPLFVAAGGLAAVTAAAVVLFLSASGSVSDQQSPARLRRGVDRADPERGRPACRGSGRDRPGARRPRRRALGRTHDARPARPAPARARLRAPRGRLAHRA